MTFRKVFHPILYSSKAKALRRRRVHLCDPYLSTVSWRIQDRLCIFSLCFSFLFPHHTSLHIPIYSACPAGCKDILPLLGIGFEYFQQLVSFQDILKTVRQNSSFEKSDRICKENCRVLHIHSRQIVMSLF